MKNINPAIWHNKGEVGKLDIKPLEVEITNPKEPIRRKNCVWTDPHE